LILLGAAIYWVGYYGFFTHLQNIAYSSLCLFLLITGLLIAGWNSSNLYRGK
jgi:hypothetical protein